MAHKWPAGHQYFRQDSEVATADHHRNLQQFDLSSGNVPGRYTLSITTAKGTIEFAAYTTTINTALLVQIDTNTNGSTGTAYQQSSPVDVDRRFATNLTGCRLKQAKTLGSFEQDASGQVVLGTNSGLRLFQRNFGRQQRHFRSGEFADQYVEKQLQGTPASNRGTAVLQTANGPFNITYYLVSPTTALYIDTDCQSRR